MPISLLQRLGGKLKLPFFRPPLRAEDLPELLQSRDEKTRALAREKLGQLGEEEIRAHFTDAALAAHHPAPSTRLAHLEKLATDGERMDVFERTKCPRVQERAVAAVDDLPLLEAALKALHQGDKHKNQLCRNRVAALKEARKNTARDNAQAEALCAKLEALAEKPWEPGFAHQFLHLRRQLKKCAALSGAVAERAARAEKTCERTVDDHSEWEAIPGRQAREADALREKIDALKKDADGAREAWEGLDEWMERARGEWLALTEQVAPARAAAGRWRDGWRILEGARGARARLTEREPARLRLLEEAPALPPTEGRGWLARAEQLRGEVDWPADFPPPAELRALKDAAAALSEKRAREGERRKALKTKFDKLFKSLSSLVRQKNLRAAMAVRRKISGEIEKLPDAGDREYFSARGAPLEEEIKRLLDWKSFASESTLLQLCEEMEKLGEEKRPPRAKSGHMRDLREKWRRTGHSPRSEELWPRFKAATDKVMEQCAGYFEEMDKKRQANLERLNRACDALEECLARLEGKKASWQEVSEAWQALRAEKKQNAPLPRGVLDGVKLRHQKLGQRAREALAAFEEGARGQKESLIEMAKKLAGIKNPREAVQKAEFLRLSWKKLPAADPGDPLGRQFEEAIAAATGEYHRQAEAKKREEEEKNRQFLEALRPIQKLAKMDIRQFAESEGEYARLRAAAGEALEQADEAAREELREKLRAACEAVEARHAERDHWRRAREEEDLAKKAALCQALEWARNADEQKAARERLEKEWGAAPSATGAAGTAPGPLSARREAAVAGKAGGDEAARRMLCIQLEILLGAETPGEDLPRRREYQMSRLVEGPGQDNLSPEQTAERATALCRQWLCGPVAGADFERAIAPRFEALRRRIPAKRAPRPQAENRRKTDAGRKKRGKGAPPRHKGKAPGRKGTPPDHKSTPKPPRF